MQGNKHRALPPAWAPTTSLPLVWLHFSTRLIVCVQKTPHFIVSNPFSFIFFFGVLKSSCKNGLSKHTLFCTCRLFFVFSPPDESATALNQSVNPLSLFLSAARAISDVCHFPFTRASCQPFTDATFSSNGLKKKKMPANGEAALCHLRGNKANAG